MVSLNYKHYMIDAELVHAARFAAFGTAFFPGATANDLSGIMAGPGANVPLPADVTPVFNKADSAGVEAFRDIQNDIEGRMASLGAELIHSNTGGAETAEAVRIRTGSRTSAIVEIVANAGRAIETLYRIMAEMMGADPSEVSVTLSRDFVETRLSGADLTALVSAWQAGAFGGDRADAAVSTLYHQLRQGEILPKNMTEKEFAAAHAQGETVDVIGEALGG